MKTIRQKVMWRLLLCLGFVCPLVLNAQNVDDTGTLDPVIDDSNDDAIVFASVRSVGSGDIDAQFSFKSSETTASGWDQFAGIIRFIDGQVFDARDAGTYTYVDELAYDFSESYYIWSVIHFATKTYDVYIQPVSEGTTYTIAEGYGWRDGGDLEVPSIDTWVASNNNVASNLVVGAVEYVSGVGEVPASISDATLSDLSLNVGELSPAFDPATTSYTATIPSGISQFTISATPSGRGSFVTGDSTITVAPEGGSVDVVIVSEDSTAEKTYTIDYTVAADNSNATLASLTTDVGSLSPEFNSGTLNYVLSVPASATTVNITATPAGAEATVSGDGEIDLASLNGPVEIIVTAADETTTLTYTIKVSLLELKHSYTFDDGTANDMVGTVNGTLNGPKISIADGKCTVSGAGSNTDGFISLDGAELALNTYQAITIEAYIYTSEGANGNSYTMLTYFGNNTGGNRCLWFQPTRSGATESRAETNNGSFTVTASLDKELDDGYPHHVVVTLTGDFLKYYLDGELVSSVATNADFISTLDTQIAHIFKGADGWPDPNYNVSLDEFNIYDGEMDSESIAKSAADFLSDATLAGIELSHGVLDPAFDPEITSYSVTVPSGTSNVTVTAVPNSPGATATGDGEVDVTAPTELVVTAVNGQTTKSYTINWTVTDAAADATLKKLAPGVSTLEPAFNPAITQYNLSLPYGTKSVDFEAVANADGATVSGNGSLDVSSGSGTYEVSVTSANESTTTTYTVDAKVDEFTITSLTVEGLDFDGNVVTGTLSPALTEGVNEYSITLPSSTVKAYIAAIGTNDPNAFIEHSDTVDVKSGSVDLPITVTSENLESSIAYNVTVNLAGGVYNTSSGTFDPSLTATNHVVYSRIDVTDNGVAIDGLFAFGNGPLRDWAKTSGGLRFTQGDGIVQLRDGGAYLPAPGTEGALAVHYDTTYHCWLVLSPADGLYSAYVQIEGAASPVIIGEEAQFRYQTDIIDRWAALSATGSNQGLNVRRVELVNEVGEIPDMSTDATLTGISLDRGSLSPQFNPQVTAYDVVVPFGTESVEVSATAANKWAAVDGTGEVVMEAGSGTASLLVKAEDTTVSKTYTLNFTEASEASDASLGSMTVDVGELSPSFNPGVTEYELTVPYGTSTVNITTETNVASASVSGDGAIDVSAGGTIPVEILVTAEDGNTTETYTVTIAVEEASSDATLTFLRVDAGTLDPAFSPATTSYALEVPFGTESVKVTYKPADLNASVSITSDGIIPVSVGTTSTVEVVVTAEDGTTSNTYTVDITVTDPSSDATLSALSVEADGASFSPEFDPSVFTYTLDVPYGVNEVVVNATASHHGATVSGDGAIDVSSGSATATIVVTAEDESTETYTIEMTMLPASTDATLSHLSVEGGTLEPAFDPAVFEYESVVPLGTTTAQVIATVNFDRATMTGAGAVDVISGSGETNVVVTAEDGTTTNTYNVMIYVGSKPDVTLGTDDELNQLVSVYPNPANSFINVDLKDSKVVNPTLTIFDAKGRSYFIQKEIAEKSIKVDLKHFNKGLYFIKIGDEEHSIIKRFIKVD